MLAKTLSTILRMDWREAKLWAGSCCYNPATQDSGSWQREVEEFKSYVRDTINEP
jgi:hypothetical protein